MSQHLFGLSTLSLGHVPASISGKSGKHIWEKEFNEFNGLNEQTKLKQKALAPVQVGMYYADPVKLDATERTVETSAELCQQRCQVVPECSHFTFWPDPGTGPFSD